MAPDQIFKLIAIICYFAVMIGIGLWANLRTKDLSDYMLGGRSLSPAVAALSAGASDMSGWLLLGLPGALYMTGLADAWIAIGLSIGAWLNWKFVAPRLRTYTEVAQNSITIPSFFENRLKDQSRLLRVVSGLLILVFFTFYVSSGMVSGGIFFEHSFGTDYRVGMLIVAGVTVLYTFFGGFIGASYTDMMQGLLMMAALIIIPIITITQVGGPAEMIATVVSVNPNAFSLFKGVGFGATFGPAVLLSLFWKRLSAIGTMCGMIAGAVTVFTWQYTPFSALYEIIPGFIINLVVAVGVSLVTPRPDIDAEFDHAVNETRSQLVAQD